MSTPPPFITDTIRRAFQHWGIPAVFFDRDTTEQSLAAMLDIAEPRMATTNYRLFPTSFYADDPNLRAFPRPLQWRWESCERTLRFFDARAVMTRVPHFWQLESPAHAICRNVGAPLFTNEIENIPLGAAAIISAEINVVITDAHAAAAFSSYLAQHRAPMPAWILIHAAASDWTVPAALLQSGKGVAQEVHLFPGVPILEQCFALASGKHPHFHLSDAYFWDLEDTRARIISLGDDPLPLYRYVLPFALEVTGTCACGKLVVQKKPI